MSTSTVSSFMPAGLTGYSLSIDNTFIIMVIMSSFHVPKEYQLRALFFGVVFSLTFRGILIVLGGAALQRYTWLYYIFGTFIVYTAVKLARDPGGEPEVDNAVLRSRANGGEQPTAGTASRFT